MSSDPRIRAGFVQGTIETIDSLGGDATARVRAELKPESLREVESASSVSWIDVGVDVELTEAMFRILGDEQARKAMRQNLVGAFETPLLRPMLVGALGIFSSAPVTMLKWISKIWSLLFNDCGKLELAEQGENSAVVVLKGAPPLIAESDPYLQGTEGALEGFFEVLGMEATIRRERSGPDILFHIAW